MLLATTFILSLALSQPHQEGHILGGATATDVQCVRHQVPHAAPAPVDPPRSGRFVRHEQRIGHAYKHGERIGGDIALGEASWTSDGRLLERSSVSSSDMGTISDEKTSYLEGYLHSRTSTRTVSCTYDGQGRLIEESHVAFGAVYSTLYSYDSRGRRTGARLFEGKALSGTRVCAYDAADSLVASCDFDKHKEPLTADSITYDGQHRRLSETHLNFGAHGRLVSETSKRYTYDARGRLSAEYDESDGNLIAVKRYTYDGDDSHPRALVDGERMITYLYDPDGRLVEERESYSNVPRGYRKLEYDDDGTLIRELSYNSKDELVDEIVHEIEYW